jgi:dTDP-4-dehydrorhamnose reductase
LATRHIIPITAQEYPTAAARPAYSVLSNSRVVQKFGVVLPDWRTQMQRCFVSESIPAKLLAD